MGGGLSPAAGAAANPIRNFQLAAGARAAGRQAGNGSLMRLAPVAIRHWQDRTLQRDVAARQSHTTHAAPDAVDACAAFAGVLADAIEGRASAPFRRGSRRHTSYAKRYALGHLLACT